MNRKQTREAIKIARRMAIAPKRLECEGRPMSPEEIGFRQLQRAKRKKSMEDPKK